ncbi:YveK family protein [Caldalkalibacillus salinus]|uniref:YveK family protein n=1 Tax=Caldalkalibacillus salinus TaxID=2803787 RepID=UPI001922EC16|nr:Wzz/FepE/Etk N-terminal domain-containing protein [Caldalkalibacillus salinus]
MTEEQNKLHMEDEISLRELIEVVLNGKWIIASVTAIAVLLSGINSFFILDPTYEASATVMVTADTDNLNLESYVAHVSNNQVMSGTIQQLDHEQDISINSLRQKVRAEIVGDTNLIRIYALDNNPEQAAHIANVVTSEYIKYMYNQSTQQLTQQLKYEIQMINEDIEIEQNSLKDILEKLNKTPQILVTNNSLTEDSFLHSVVTENTSSNADSGSIQYQNEHLNPLYLDLQQKQLDIDIKITELQNRKNNLEQRIAEEQFAVEENLLITSQAVEPESPASPNKKLNVAIAGVLGVMISVFVVFGRYYWINSAPQVSPVQRDQNGEAIQ